MNFVTSWSPTQHLNFQRKAVKTLQFLLYVVASFSILLCQGGWGRGWCRYELRYNGDSRKKKQRKYELVDTLFGILERNKNLRIGSIIRFPEFWRYNIWILILEEIPAYQPLSSLAPSALVLYSCTATVHGATVQRLFASALRVGRWVKAKSFRTEEGEVGLFGTLWRLSTPNMHVVHKPIHVINEGG